MSAFVSPRGLASPRRSAKFSSAYETRNLYFLTFFAQTSSSSTRNDFFCRVTIPPGSTTHLSIKTCLVLLLSLYNHKCYEKMSFKIWSLMNPSELHKTVSLGFPDIHDLTVNHFSSCIHSLIRVLLWKWTPFPHPPHSSVSN